MNIELNKVTWYSKALAVVLFVGIFFLGFWLGTMKTEKIYIHVPFASTSHVPVLIKNGEMNFSGHIVRGEKFQKDLGNNLIFRLTPTEAGWDADVVASGEKQGEYGFASIITPPFHGINPLQIEGWHFRNTDNTASNDGSVNAPQETRNFSFVLNAEDASTTAYTVWEFTSGKTQDFSPNVPTGSGTIMIKNLKLGNLIKDKQAWIESMDFTVQLNIPDELKK